MSAARREFRACTEGVAPEDLDRELTYARARDKTDKSLDAYKFYVNALYVAMTRAVKSVMVIESDTSHPLWGLLAVHRLNERVELVRDDSSREDWQREARRLELQGKAEQAEQIRREILETEPVPWPVIDAITFHAIRAKALGPGPPRPVSCPTKALAARLLAPGRIKRFGTSRGLTNDPGHAIGHEPRAPGPDARIFVEWSL